MNTGRRILLWALVALAAGLMLASCTTRKNTAASRKYQAFITRYNVYYNGDQHFGETLADMERNYEDDYTDFLFPHPAEAKAVANAPQPSGDFKRSIEKAQKSIQLHSIKKKPKKKSGKQSDAYKAWLKREEYNPFIHNAWMMMARSQYLNGDFPGAAATFYYISRHFSWLPETVVEAQLWQARSYVAFDWVNEADAIFQRIKPEQLTSGKLKALYDFVEADIALKRGDYAAAIAPLEKTIKRTGGAQKTRLRFLLGQCYAREGRKADAYKAFKQAAQSGGTTYRTKLNARIKQSEVYEGNDVEPEIKSLRRMTSLDRNKPYLDQIYYAIGNLYLSRGDTAKAIENYVLAADKSERNGIEKAISNITLGQLYYEQGRYDLAQPRFSEAVPLLPETYANYEVLKKRSDVLDELSVYAQNVVVQDSLLRLAEMSPDEQMKVIKKIIDDLKKKEKEEAEEAARQAHDAEAAANQGGNTDANAPTQFQ
ncbi:MAG: tetratricopeptide repeat protein, partial [Muribaculaceae bacterium]|nr:tetratricopeptide repeat protein [Muribaculaceae bacterium]